MQRTANPHTSVRFRHRTPISFHDKMFYQTKFNSNLTVGKIMQVYFEIFNSKKDVLKEYDILESEISEYDVLFAYYTYEFYEGESLVILKSKTDGNLYEVNGSHCSCYGLEGQWEPEQTTVDALMKRDTGFFNDIVKQHIQSHLDKFALQKEIKRPSVSKAKLKI